MKQEACPRMGPYRRCRWRRLEAALAAALAIAAGGCESASKTGDDRPATLARPMDRVDEPGAADAAAQERVAQAQRDVDQYLRQREGTNAAPAWTDDGALAPGGGGGGTVANADTPRGPGRRVIFNDRPGDPSLAGNSEASRPEADGDGADSPPLFRDSSRTPNVGEFKAEGTAAAEAELRPHRLRQLMVDLRRELYIEGAHSDQPLRQLLPIAAMSMIDPEAAINPDAVPDLTAKERELLGALQTFFRSLGTRLESGTDVEEAIAAGVRELRAAVIREPQLQLPALALCYRVDGYGKYERFSANRFLAHSSQQVIVYVEVDDFTSEVNDAGEWVTQLSQQVTIYSDRDGIPVWRSGDMQTAVDRARNQRHDFFLLQIITLPQALSVGKYQLKVRVRDETSGAEAESAVEFEMVADPKLAAKVP